MEFVFYFLVFTVGGFLAIQGPMNAKLAQNFGRHAVSTVSLTFFIGAVLLAVLALVLQVPLPSLADNTTTWWHWLGGLLGACYVATISFAVPKIGTASAMSLVLLGQVISSIMLDHFGLIGMAEHTTSWERLAGVALVFVGAVLVRKTPAAPKAAAESASSQQPEGVGVALSSAKQ